MVIPDSNNFNPSDIALRSKISESIVSPAGRQLPSDEQMLHTQETAGGKVMLLATCKTVW